MAQPKIQTTLPLVESDPWIRHQMLIHRLATTPAGNISINELGNKKLLDEMPFSSAIHADSSVDDGAMFEIGIITALHQDIPKAIVAMRSAVEADPAEPSYGAALGLLYENQGDFDAAIHIYVDMLHNQPILLFTPWFRELNRQQPQLANTILNLLSKEVNQASSIDPIDSARSGWILLYEDQLNEAFEHFKYSVEALPNLGRAWLGLGITQYRSGKFSQSIDSLRRAAFLGAMPAQAPPTHHFQRMQMIYGVSGGLTNDLIPQDLQSYLRIDRALLRGVIDGSPPAQR